MENNEPGEILTELRREYEAVKPRLASFLEKLREQIETILTEQSISLGFPVETRVKSWDSAVTKIRREGLDGSPITAVHDLAGLRIILLFRRDLDTVEELLSNSLNVLAAEDTGTRLTEQQFGYQSRHYSVRFPEAWLSTPTLSDLGGFTAEIQVRTLAQHIWATASHALQYKSPESVPFAIRRAIHRAAALLETVDLEFERVLMERQSYIQTIEEAQASQPSQLLDQALDADTLQLYAKWKYPDFETRPALTARLLEDLDGDSYTKLRDIDEVVFRARRAVEQYRHEAPDLFGTSTDYLTKSLGFVDLKFRAAHPFGSQTRDAFERHQGLVRGLGHEKGQERQE